NDANTLAISLRATSEAELAEILDAWFGGEASGDEDDAANVGHIAEIERQGAPGFPVIRILSAGCFPTRPRLQSPSSSPSLPRTTCRTPFAPTLRSTSPPRWTVRL